MIDTNNKNRIQELLIEVDRLRMENMNLNSMISDLEDELNYKDEEIEAHRDLINKLSGEQVK